MSDMFAAKVYLSDLLAFVRMKPYAMVLPNVPIEISSLSPLDAG